MRGNEADNRSGPVEEDMPLQLRVWRIERAGWYALLLLVMLALLGLFSKGPLSDATVTGALCRLQVDYQRFARGGATSQLVLTLREAPPQSQIFISSELLEGYSIESIHPAPVASSNGEQGGLRLTVATELGAARLSLILRAKGVGRFDSWIGAGGERVELSQFIYP